jgi:hypothetical protein
MDPAQCAALAVTLLCGALFLWTGRRPPGSAYGAAREVIATGARVGLPGAPVSPYTVNRPGAPPPPREASSFRREAEAALRAAPPGEPPPAFEAEAALGPERLWRPNFEGVQSFFVEAPCLVRSPAPRLWATELHTLLERRSRLLGATYPEPLAQRQAWLQFLSHDWRGRKDRYTRPSESNSFEVHRACEGRRPLAVAPPEQGLAAPPVPRAPGGPWDETSAAALD